MKCNKEKKIESLQIFLLSSLFFFYFKTVICTEFNHYSQGFLKILSIYSACIVHVYFLVENAFKKYLPDDISA